MPSAATYTLSLHDALPIYLWQQGVLGPDLAISMRRAAIGLALGLSAGILTGVIGGLLASGEHLFNGIVQIFNTIPILAILPVIDRKSTRLNSSHQIISYAVRGDLHSFPTRRSSDLPMAAGRAGPGPGDLDAPGCHRACPWPERRHPHGCHRRPAGQRRAPVQRDRADLQHDPDPGHLAGDRSEEHTSELQSPDHIVCRPRRPTLFPYTTLFRSTYGSRACWARTWRSRCAGLPSGLPLA